MTRLSVTYIFYRVSAKNLSQAIWYWNTCIAHEEKGSLKSSEINSRRNCGILQDDAIIMNMEKDDKNEVSF